MIERHYLSTIHPEWPLARQRKLLGMVEREWVDEIKVSSRKRLQPEDLKQRAVMLKPIGRDRPETIVVASLACLAVSWRDLGDVLVAAAERNATIRALDSGVEIPPSPGTALMNQAMQWFAAAHQRRGLGRTREEIALAKIEDTKARIERIRHLWPLRTHTKEELFAIAGEKGKPLAPATAKRYLGSRHLAQAEHDRGQAREAGRQAARAKKKEQSS